MSEKLKPCPFCGGARPRENGDSEIDWVSCDDCGAEGPTGNNRAEAARLWNTRKDASHE